MQQPLLLNGQHILAPTDEGPFQFTSILRTSKKRKLE